VRLISRFSNKVVHV